MCGANGAYGPCICNDNPAFDRIRSGLVGTWIGTQTNEWTPSFQVRITFGADGSYTGHCAQAACPAPVFYWGVDDDSPSKTYQLQDLQADGTGTGVLQVYFAPADVTTGELDEVNLSSDGQHLQFQFWNTWSGSRTGPLTFDLTRAP